MTGEPMSAISKLLITSRHVDVCYDTACIVNMKAHTRVSRQVESCEQLTMLCRWMKR